MEDTPGSNAVVLENVPDDMHKKYLVLLLDSISGYSEGNHYLEFIPESNSAVVTFNDPSGMSLTCDVMAGISTYRTTRLSVTTFFSL